MPCLIGAEDSGHNIGLQPYEALAQAPWATTI
jgi:hypothetical protein